MIEDLDGGPATAFGRRGQLRVRSSRDRPEEPLPRRDELRSGDPHRACLAAGLAQTLTYHWSVQDPADVGVALPTNNTTDPGQSFTATMEGQYTVNLTVDDGKLSSATETQFFTATDGGP